MTVGGRQRAGILLFAVAVVALLGMAAPAQAHPISTSAVLLDVGPERVTAKVELPLDELSVSRDEVLTSQTATVPSTLLVLRRYVQAHMKATDSTRRAWTTTVSGGRIELIDGIDHLVLDATFRPHSGVVGDFVLHDDVIIDRLQSHRVFVSGRYGSSGAYTTLAMLSWQTESVPVASATPDAANGIVQAIGLGVHHIASGSDHLLFLLMLLLPAPCIVRAGRWASRPDNGLAGLRTSAVRVLHVVTAFALGHTCTLVLGALGWVDLPSELVESGIALSVLISAIHAIRPLIRRGEVYIAAGFGLLHGLSFASLLGSLDLSPANVVGTLFGFNVGIEVAQLIVVAMVMPSLVALGTTSAFPALRVGLAVTGAALATGWFADRAGLIPTNPLEPLGEVIVSYPFELALCIALVALAAVLLGTSRAASGVGRPAGIFKGPARGGVMERSGSYM